MNYVYAESSPKSAAATDENIYSNTCHIVRVDDAQKSADHSLVKQEDLEQHEELLKELKV